MRRWRTVRSSGRVLGGLVAAAGVIAVMALAASGGGGCTLLLDTSGNPQKCSNDADCARFPDAACDNARKQCVPKLPYVTTDSGAPADGGGGGAGGAPACDLSFDNRSRLPGGPDGGLRPLPGGP